MSSSRRERELDKRDEAAEQERQETLRQQKAAWELARPAREEAERKAKEAAEESQRERQRQLAEKARLDAIKAEQDVIDTDKEYCRAVDHLNELNSTTQKPVPNVAPIRGSWEERVKRNAEAAAYATPSPADSDSRREGRKGMLLGNVPSLDGLAGPPGYIVKASAEQLRTAIENAKDGLHRAKRRFLDEYTRFLAGLEFKQEGDELAAAIAWSSRIYRAELEYLSGATDAIQRRDGEIEITTARLADTEAENNARKAAEKRVEAKLAQLRASGPK